MASLRPLLPVLSVLALACARDPGMHAAPVIDAPSTAAQAAEDDAGEPAPLLAGAAKVDITPIAGVPLGGHSLESGTGHGLWTRLWARAIYVEDAQGEPLVLVVADLWSVPAGLVDAVVERVREHHGLEHIGRAQLLLSATHTHHSPANYATNILYNRAASHKMGFDPELFDFLVARIASAVASAASARSPARLRLDSASVAGVARNRSVPPLLQDPEAEALIAANAELETCPDYPREVEGVDPCQAVDPTLTTLRVEDLEGRPLAVAAFFSAHPTAMENKTDAYNGDFFAVATAKAEAALAAGRPEIGDPVVALFNGPQGDVSPNWGEQGRADTLVVGERLGAAIIDTAKLGPDGDGKGGCGREILGSIESGFERLALADQSVARVPGARTAKRFLPGKAVLPGAEDGPTRFRERIPEGQTVERHRRPGQGPKEPMVAPGLVTLLFPRSAYPQEVPLSVHRLGPLTFAGLPGEFTTVMGMRVREAIAASNAAGAPRTVLIGLAGEYMSYFVTPEEYTLQHYEGGSTMWGQYAGTLVAESYGRLAPRVALDDAAGLPGEGAGPKAVVKPGMRRSFALGPGPRSRRALRDLGERLHAQLDLERPVAELPRLHIETAAPSWTGPTWPEVRVERRDEAGEWQLLTRDDVAVDHRGAEFVSFPIAIDRRRWRWAIWWIGAPPAGEALRLHAFGPDGSEHCSQIFEAGHLVAPVAVACAGHHEAIVDARDGIGVEPAQP